MRTIKAVLLLVLLLPASAAFAADTEEDEFGSYELTAEDYKERGVAADAKGEYAKAIEYFDKSLELNPRDGTLWHYKAQTYKNMEDYKAAVECYEKAIDYYDMVISIHPDDGESWWMKGNALKKLGKYGRAKDCFDAAKDYGYEGEDE